MDWRKLLTTPAVPEQLVVIQTLQLDSVVFIFSLCFISVDVDDHLLDGLSQKSSFFLPFQGTVRVSGQKEKVQNKNHG